MSAKISAAYGHMTSIVVASTKLLVSAIISETYDHMMLVVAASTVIGVSNNISSIWSYDNGNCNK